jgi:hypothetical protein
MLSIPEFSIKLEVKEISDLEQRVKDEFGLEQTPNLAIVQDNKNRYGDFRDLVAYDNNHYFLRLERETGKTVYKKEDKNLITIGNPPNDEEKGHLSGYMQEKQERADSYLKEASKEGREKIFYEDLAQAFRNYTSN